MDSASIRVLALLAANGAVLAFVMQNLLDEQISVSDGSSLVAISVVGLVSGYVALLILEHRKKARLFAFVLEGFAASAITAGPLSWLARAVFGIG